MCLTRPRTRRQGARSQGGTRGLNRQNKFAAREPPAAIAACHTLQNLSDGNGVAIADAGGIPPLVALLQSGTDGAKIAACHTLHNLSVGDDHNDNKVRIVALGGIPPLVTLLNGATDVHKLAAARALFHLAWFDNHQVMIAAAGAIPPLVEMLKDQEKQAAALQLLYRLAKNDANKMTIGSAGSIPPLFAIVKEGRTEQVFNVTIAELAAEVLRLLKQDANIAPMIQPDDEAPADEARDDFFKETLAKISALFKRIDRNGNGLISRAEIIKTVSSDAVVREALGLPAKIGEEQRGELEAVFQDMDKDDSRQVDFTEFANFIFRKYSMPFEIAKTNPKP